LERSPFMVDLNAQRDTTQGSFLYESSNMRFSSPLFAALSRSCAQDDDICELGSAARPGQPIALFILLTAQYLVFRAPDSELAGYFPSMTDTPKPPEEAFPVFREFCLDRREAMRRLLATRTVNANLVERASFILPVSQYVATLTHEPLTLIEMCCSAGLNLLFDEYHYDYGASGQVGAEDSPVRLSCKVISKARPPIDRIPRVKHRVGIDLVRVDCSDPDGRMWMEAMLAPEWRVERARLKKALTVRADRNVRIVQGDMLSALPPLLEELPGALMLLHTFCNGQWFAAAQGELDEILRRAAQNRDIHRIGVETPDGEPPRVVRARLAAVSAAGISIRQKNLPGRIEHTLYSRGAAAETELLGYADGMGSWIDWHAPG
jgi:hypothetical protein